jgi:hypothetical protein
MEWPAAMRALFIMNNHTTLLFACLAGLGMSCPSFAQDLYASPEGKIEHTLDKRINAEERAWDVYRAQDVVGTVGQDALQEPAGQARTTGKFADRFINPHPELGCLYYDENNVRRWFPHCREL